MKRFLAIFSMCCVLFCPAVRAEEMAGADKPAEQASEQDRERAQEVQEASLAAELAHYGMQTQSAEALIMAAKMMATHRAKAPEGKAVQAEGLKGGEEKAASSNEMTPDTLLAKARELASDNATLMQWADEVENIARKSSRSPARGLLQGYYELLPKYRHTMTEQFLGGQRAYVQVQGEPGAALDIYVYDSYGNPVISSVGHNTSAWVYWTPNYNAYYQVVVYNRGGWPVNFSVTMQ
ncbi:MAG: hypothetical protein KC910_04110 [Candidatus Eremiobacteraeota bacterium]|nr:hypothetical protein [Candidatus Eremiobacteraeota bacterium]